MGLPIKIRAGSQRCGNAVTGSDLQEIIVRYKERIPDSLFQQDGHYLGRPADFGDRIVYRRIRLVETIPDFTGEEYSLLDIGCGNGASMFLLSGKMRHCLGVEITNEHEDDFNNFVAEKNVRNCEYRILDVVRNKATQKFDRIISFEVIEHLSDESGLQFYFDSLKTDGILAVTVPNKWWIFETHGAKLPLLPWNRVPFFSWLPRPIHERFANARIYTKRRIKRLLEQYGFEVVQTKYVTAPMDVLPDGRFKNWIIKNIFNSDSTRIPFKATSILAVARIKKDGTSNTKL